ncbi:hypothetical protein COLO4_17748 [Corchorus olitorius]|uniref:Uncharacterized protein n=1 Tax=Corchorus olitorius TaxID=93759 RepID=A0A1R3JBM9_9ROSI|nr:hypothetical protein COLO4_17748 [Corchorus olitorius]
MAPAGELCTGEESVKDGFAFTGTRHLYADSLQRSSLLNSLTDNCYSLVI